MDSESDTRMSSYQETENDFLQFAQNLRDKNSVQSTNSKYSNTPGLKCLFALTSFLEEAISSQQSVTSSELQQQSSFNMGMSHKTNNRNALDTSNASQHPKTEDDWDGVYLTQSYTNALKAQENKGLAVGARLSTTMKRVKTKIMRGAHHTPSSVQNVDRMKYSSADDCIHIGALVAASTKNIASQFKEKRGLAAKGRSHSVKLRPVTIKPQVACYCGTNDCAEDKHRHSDFNQMLIKTPPTPADLGGVYLGTTNPLFTVAHCDHQLALHMSPLASFAAKKDSKSVTENSFPKLSQQQRTVHSVEDLLDTDDRISQGDLENTADYDDRCQSLPDILLPGPYRRSYDAAVASPYVSPSSDTLPNQPVILEQSAASLEQAQSFDELARGEQAYLDSLRAKSVSKQFARKMKQWHEKAESKFGDKLAEKTRTFRQKARAKKPIMLRQRSRSHDRLVTMPFDVCMDINWTHQRSASQDLPCPTDNEFLPTVTPQSHEGPVIQSKDNNFIQAISNPANLAMHVDTTISQNSIVSKNSSSASPDSGTESCNDCSDEIGDQLEINQGPGNVAAQQSEPTKTTVTGTASFPLERGRRVSPSRIKRVINRHTSASVSLMDASFEELAVGDLAKFSDRQTDLSEQRLFSTSPTINHLRRLSLDMPKKSLSPPSTLEWTTGSLPKTSPYTSEEALAGIKEDLQMLREHKARAQAEHSNSFDDAVSTSPKLQVSHKPSVISVCVDSGLIMEESDDESVDYNPFIQLSPKQSTFSNATHQDVRIDDSPTSVFTEASDSNEHDTAKPFRQYKEITSTDQEYQANNINNDVSKVSRSNSSKMTRQQRLEEDTLQSGEFQPIGLEPSPTIEIPAPIQEIGSYSTYPASKKPTGRNETESNGTKHLSKTDSSPRIRTHKIGSGAPVNIHDLVNKFTSTEPSSANSPTASNMPPAYNTKTKQQIRYLLEAGRLGFDLPKEGTVQRRRSMFMDSHGRSGSNADTGRAQEQAGVLNPSHQRVTSLNQ